MTRREAQSGQVRRAMPLNQTHTRSAVRAALVSAREGAAEFTGQSALNPPSTQTHLPGNTGLQPLQPLHTLRPLHQSRPSTEGSHTPPLLKRVHVVCKYSIPFFSLSPSLTLTHSYVLQNRKGHPSKYVSLRR